MWTRLGKKQVQECECRLFKVNYHCCQNMPLKNVTHFKEDTLLCKSLQSPFESAHQHARACAPTRTHRERDTLQKDQTNGELQFCWLGQYAFVSQIIQTLTSTHSSSQWAREQGVSSVQGVVQLMIQLCSAPQLGMYGALPQHTMYLHGMYPLFNKNPSA